MENPATQKDSSTVMNPVRRAGLIILMFGLGLLFWSVPAHSENAVVVRVIDGDTLKVWITDEIQTARLIGVDTPETVHPTKEVQRGGKEASAFTQAALDRQQFPPGPSKPGLECRNPAAKNHKINSLHTTSKSRKSRLRSRVRKYL